MKKLLLSLAMLVGLSTAAFAAPATTFAGYTGNCTADVNNYHATLDRLVGPLKVDYARATIEVARTINTCDELYLSPYSGSSWILPVNIQGHAFVQLGYGRVSEGDLNWYYTYDETSGGVMSVPPSTTIPDPVPGHRYTLWIWYDANVDKWWYQVQDLTIDETYGWWGKTAARHYGYEVWSGFEVYDSGDQLGGFGPYELEISNIGYQFVAENTTVWFTHTAQYNGCCEYEGDPATRMSYWNTYSGTRNGRSYFGAYSDWH